MMKPYFILFLLFIFVGNAQTINKKEDSLIFLLTSTTNPDEKISLGKSLLLKDEHSDRFKAYVNRSLGSAFMTKGEFKTGQEFYQKAIAFAEKSDDYLCKVHVNCSMGEAYGALGLTSEGEEYLLKAKEYSSHLKDNEESTIAIFSINSILGNLYKSKKQPDKALNIYKNSLFLSNKIKHRPEYYGALSYTYLGLADAFAEKKIYDSSRSYYDKGIEISLKDPQKRYIYALYSGLGDIEVNAENYTQAIKNYNDALSFSSQLPPYATSDIYKKISDVYLKLNSARDASKYADSSRIHSEKATKQGNEGLETAVNKIKNDKIKIINEKDKKVYNLQYLLLIFGVLLIISTFWYFFTLKKQKKLYQEYVKQFQSQHSTQTEKIIENLSTHSQTSINTDLELDILEKLNTFENEEIFRDKDMSLSKLASHLNTNTNYLSRIINQRYNKNFNNYISELRINYITKKISENPSYRNYKISFLAEDSGFISHSAFSTKFKEVTGISPSQFLSFSSSEKPTP